MTEDARRLLEAALKLPEPERLRLAHELWESVSPDASLDDEDAPLHPEWTAELERRIRDLDEGRVKPIPFDEALAQARARIEARRRASGPS